MSDGGGWSKIKVNFSVITHQIPSDFVEIFSIVNEMK